jgi:hypothetical protein|tara:strand:+ start:578 stop:1291 length:714 start_codon:yes stop_codon:yes gene_type:complete
MRKIILFCVIICGFSYSSKSQNTTINLGNYDDNSIHYGFLLGVHSSYYRLSYSDQFVSSEYSNLHSILPSSKPGFKLGFVSDFNLIHPFDFRMLLQVAFYEFNLDYLYTDGSLFSDTRSATFLEFPLLIKYKSKRRSNHRMYMLGGLKPSLEIGAKNKDEAGKDILNVSSFDLSLEIGFGSDVFFQLFKLSPEVRYSRGLINLLKNKTDNSNKYNIPIDKLVVHNISIFFTFEGGPK